MDGYLIESAVAFAEKHTFFARAERVKKDELFDNAPPLAGDAFWIGKLSLGYVYDVVSVGHIKAGIGGLISGYAVPNSLASTYGAHPTSYAMFLRLKLE